LSDPLGIKKIQELSRKGEGDGSDSFSQSIKLIKEFNREHKLNIPTNISENQKLQ
jgi:hypothetical protein